MDVDLGGVFGQSDAKGNPLEQISEPFYTEPPPSCDDTVCWDWDGEDGNSTIQNLIEPVDNAFTNAYKPVYGSLLPAFSNAFTAVSGRPLLLVRTAIGGTPLLQANIAGNQNWSPTGVLFTQGCNRVLAAATALASAGHTVQNIFGIWSQGYRDALIGNNLEDYEAAQADLLTRFRDYLDVPDFQLYTEGNYAPPSAAGNFDLLANIGMVRNGQLAAIDDTEGLHLAFDGGQFFTTEDEEISQFDELHKSQKGLNIAGTAMGEYAADDLFGLEPVVASSLIARLLLKAPPLIPPAPPATAGFVRNHTGAQNKVSGLTLAGVLDANVAADHTLILSFACDNAATSGPNITGISKPVGETASWVFKGKTGISGTGTASVVVEQWAIRTTMLWPSTFTPTVTIDTARVAKGLVLEEWSSLTTASRAVVTATSATGAPSATSATPLAGDVVSCAGGWEQALAITGDSDTTRGTWSAVHSIATSGGLDGSNARATIQHKIVDADGSQTYNPTGASNDCGVVLSVFIPG